MMWMMTIMMIDFFLTKIDECDTIYDIRLIIRGQCHGFERAINMLYITFGLQLTGLVKGKGE